MEAAEILVIILTLAFTLFLALAILLTVILIRIAKQINRITNTAERTVGNLENASSIIQRVVAPTVVTKIVAGMLKKFAGRDKR